MWTGKHFRKTKKTTQTPNHPRVVVNIEFPIGVVYILLLRKVKLKTFHSHSELGSPDMKEDCLVFMKPAF